MYAIYKEKYYPLHLPNFDTKILSVYNLLHRNLKEELIGCKRELEAKEREIESLMRR